MSQPSPIRPLVIVLSTGYAVDVTGGWEEHLANALIGEIFVTTAEGDWNSRMRAVMAEVDRVCAYYGLSYYAWTIFIVRKIEEYVGEALGGLNN